jgi:peptide/nickel transport system permease protein
MAQAQIDRTKVAPIGDTVAPEDRFKVASQWQLMWWKFRRHRLAVLGALFTLAIYIVALFAEFVAPFDPEATNTSYTYAPPVPLRFDGLQPFVYGYTSELDPVALRRTFVVDETVRHPVGFFVRGNEYKLLGLIPLDMHLIAPLDPAAPMFLLGTDRLGRDVLSRMVYGTRISMSIGLVGVSLSLTLGIMLGGMSGYYGGQLDTVIQRLIEFLRSIPAIPLWMGLAAALPANWPPLYVYFGTTLILSLIGWTSLARVVRGRLLALRGEDFVTAARLDGARDARIIARHLIPAFTSHIIATVTLAIPNMILAETALSFLGLGLRPPLISWGVLLQEAQNVRSVATAPWLLAPAVAVVLTVIALNFFGDGLRDAADPYDR